MKKIITSAALLFVTTVIFAQSDSFMTFKDKFYGEDEVYCISVNGFLARTVLSIVGEHEFKHAVRHIRNVRLVTVPKDAFEAKRVSVNGFKEVLKNDDFEEMVTVSERGEHVSVFISEAPDDFNRYMFLVDDGDSVVLIEATGYIDPEYLKSHAFLSQQKT
ncbi:MAG TPA: DUF4252 domain-containing protein [Chryseolinea sp.]|nr:DUF4252 domain-containing protein [Chryseolinea sp.]